MKHAFKFSAIFLACGLAITGCGGSGSSNSGSSNSSVTATHTAIFSDAPVSGLTYKASPSNISGTTNAKGEFDYKTGDSITFSVAGITLGTVSNLSATSTSSSPTIITPINLVAGAADASNPAVIAIGQLLGALNNVAVSVGQGINGMFVVPTVTGLGAAQAATVTTLLNALKGSQITTSNLAAALVSGGVIQSAIVAAGGTVPTAASTQSNIAHAACSSTTPALQQAKNFINSSNNILANAQTAFTTYQPTDLAGVDELTRSAGLVQSLAQYAYDQANGGSATLTTIQIQNYLNDYDQSVTNLNNLSVSATAGKVSISGNFTVQFQTGYNFDPKTYEYTPIYGNPTTVNISNFIVEAPINTTNSATYNAKLKANSSISTVTNGKTSTLLAGTDSTIAITYSSADNLQNRINTEQIPDSAQISLANISITSATNKLTLNQLTLKGQKIQYTAGGSPVTTSFVPTSLFFSGSAAQGSNTAAIDATINLTNDLSKVIALGGTTGTPQQTTTNFVQGNFALNVTTTLKTATQTNTLTAAFKGSRTNLLQGQASVDLTVNKDKLSGIATYTDETSNQPAVLEVIINDPDNCARTDIPNILKFTTSNITVNGVLQGTISKTSNSVYQAKFSDNSIIVIAP